MKINDLFQSKSLTAKDLNGKAVRVTIEQVTTQKFDEGEKPILHFVGKEKTLVLNRVNSFAIINAVGDDETDTWIGWSVVLYPTKVLYQGKMVDAIRVDDRPGATKPPAQPVRRAVAPATTPQDVFDEPADMPDDSDIPF